MPRLPGRAPTAARRVPAGGLRPVRDGRRTPRRGGPAGGRSAAPSPAAAAPALRQPELLGRERLGANGAERHRVDPEAGVHGLDLAFEEASQMRSRRGWRARSRRCARAAPPSTRQNSSATSRAPSPSRASEAQRSSASRESAASSPARSISGSGKARRARQAGGGGRDATGSGRRPSARSRRSGTASPPSRPRPVPAHWRENRRASDARGRASTAPTVLQGRGGGAGGRPPDAIQSDFDRQRRERGKGGAGRGDAAALPAEAGERPGGARRVGQARPRLEAEAGKARLHLRRHRPFAAEEMVCARNVEQQAVRAVHRASRA